MPIYIGTSGFLIQNFYPESVPSPEKLSYFAEVFTTVEINSTFYHMPRLTTITNWQKRVSQEFIFTFKVLQDITHSENEKPNKELLEKWFEVFSPFAFPEKKHVMLFQFPASFALQSNYFSELLALLPETFLYAFEFRHSSWFTQEVYDKVLSKHATIVLSDSPLRQSGQPLWPKFDLVKAEFSYIRLHGKSKLYSSSYSKEELQNIADFAAKKKREHKNVYIYFNNTATGAAAENARELSKLI